MNIYMIYVYNVSEEGGNTQVCIYICVIIVTFLIHIYYILLIIIVNQFCI